MCSCLRGTSTDRSCTALSRSPGYPELSKSYSDVASKSFCSYNNMCTTTA